MDLPPPNDAAPTTAAAKQPVLTEVPENLQRLLLTLVKTFYSLEHYVVFYHIMKRVILKEEELRDVCKIDLRQLRKFMVTLKVEKFVKERLVPEEVDGKVRKFTYFFVNYKGALNVAKYKIDHIRQKLEVREKDDVHRAFYRCSNGLCKKQYESLDMHRIFDPFTQEMRCWQCKSLVEQDETGGPSQVTRSSMAKFNEQMTGIFSLLKQMDGIRFGREIMEPPIQAPISKAEGEQIDLETKRVVNLGQRAFSAAGKTRTDLFGGEITVSIGDENMSKMAEAKPEIPWLLTSRSAEEAAAAGTSTGLVQSSEELFVSSTTELAVNQEEPLAKRPRREEIASLLAEEEAEIGATAGADEQRNGENVQMDFRESMVQESSLTIVSNSTNHQMAIKMETHTETETADGIEIEDTAEFILVQGERIHIDDIDEHHVAKMSEQEKSDYYERMQGAYADFY